MLPLPPRRLPPLGPPKLTPRQRVVAQWRGTDLAPLEATQALRAKPVLAFLPALQTELRMDRRRMEAEVVKVWNNLLDPALLAHAQPTGLRKGTLFVAVDSSVWLSEIVRYRRKEILERLQHSFSRDFIARIPFRVR